MQALPAQVFAQQPEEPVNTVSSAEAEPLIIGEAEHKRTEDTKYFELDDGTTIAAVYAMPVHYQDENGAWQDIDNTLIESVSAVSDTEGPAEVSEEADLSSDSEEEQPAIQSKEEQPAAQSEEAQAVMEDVLKNADGVQDVQFAKTAKKNKMVSVEVSGYPVSWGFTGANNSRIEVTQKEENLTGNDRFLSLPKVTQEVYYRNVFADTDLQYILSLSLIHI